MANEKIQQVRQVHMRMQLLVLYSSPRVLLVRVNTSRKGIEGDHTLKLIMRVNASERSARGERN
jgi:hypothetical protein